MVGPSLIAYILTPYLLYLIFQKRPEYLLPLIVHSFWGSQQRTIMLVGCFVCALANIDELRKYKLRSFFLFYLLFLPFFIWYTVKRYQFSGFAGMFEGLGIYLGLAAFFWGVLISGEMGAEFFAGLFWISFVLSLNQSFRFLPATFAQAWATAYMGAYLFWRLFRSKTKTDKRHTKIYIIISAISFLAWLRGLLHQTTTFTQIAVTGMAILVLFIWRYCRKLNLLISPLVLYGVSFVLLFSTINAYEEKRGELLLRGVVYGEMQIEDWSSLRQKFLQKSVGDRGPLWVATWNTIKKQTKEHWFWVPPVAAEGYYDIDLQDGSTVEAMTLLQGHNNFLELLRTYGLYGGLGVFVCLLYALCRYFPKRCLLSLYSTEFAPVFACIIGHMICGAHTGQYTIYPLFSFLLYSMFGMCYRAHFDDVQMVNYKRQQLWEVQ